MIVVPIVAENMEKARMQLLQADGDAVELRLDALDEWNFEGLKELAQMKTTIVTNRRFAEGGLRRQREKRRAAVLEEALNAKPWAIDIEVKTPDALRKPLETKARKKRVKIIASFHDFAKTPQDLDAIVRQALREGDYAKIVCLPKDHADVDRLLALVEKWRGRVVAFGLGEKWAYTRVLSLKKGAPFGFARQIAQSAPGQMTVEEMRRALA